MLKYYYRDNWTGDTHYFVSLKAATVAAQQECGTTIYIRKVGSDIVHVVKASGYCYP